jgi:3-phenylpropionate/trans-cinnamate dioxygenase ferredoxin reductase subunit
MLPLGIVKFPSLVNFKTVTLYASAVAGYVGILLLLWMYILGSRTVSKYLTSDYSKTLRVHNWLGKYGTLLIFAHPMLVTISYGESFFYGLIPNLSSTFNTYVTFGRIAIYVIGVIWLTSFILRSKLKYRPWKYIHLLSYAVIPFALLHIPMTGSSYAASLITRIYFIIIVLGFAVFTLIRSYSWLGFDKQSYNVISNQQINKRVFVIRLKPVNFGNRITLKDGQYIYIKTGIIGESHPFSVVDYNKQSGVISVAYKVYGKFTDKLSHIEVGRKLLMSGPFGDFMNNLDDKSTNVFIAGGIGITPFISPVFKSSDNKWVFYFNHDPETAMFVSDIQKIIGERLVPLYSVVAGKIMFNRETQDKILINSLTTNLVEPNNCKYYLCGPGQQIKAFENALLEFGIPKSSIDSESFDF